MNYAKGQKTPLPALLFSLFEEELGGTWPDRPGDVRPQERVQRRTVGRSSTPLSPCRCLILLCRWWQNSWWTSPSWRRWRGKRTRRWSGSRTSSSRVPLSQLQTRRLGDAGPRGSRRRGRKRSFLVVLFDARVLMQLNFQEFKFEKVTVPQIQFLDRVLDIPVVPVMGTHSAKLCRRPGDSNRSGGAADVHAETSSSSSSFFILCRSRRVSAGAVLGRVVHARRGAETVEIPQVQFLDQLFMPVVVTKPVEITQVQFLDLLFMPVVVPKPW